MDWVLLQGLDMKWTSSVSQKLTTCELRRLCRLRVISSRLSMEITAEISRCSHEFRVGRDAYQTWKVHSGFEVFHLLESLDKVRRMRIRLTRMLSASEEIACTEETMSWLALTTDDPVEGMGNPLKSLQYHTLRLTPSPHIKSE